MLSRAEGTDIAWKAGKNVTVKVRPGDPCGEWADAPSGLLLPPSAPFMPVCSVGSSGCDGHACMLGRMSLEETCWPRGCA